MGFIEQYLLQLKKEKRRWRRSAVILTTLSILVVAGVSWSLRITGITLVNDACCGYAEHQHTDECLSQRIICGFDEEAQSATETEQQHIHVAECYQIDYQCGSDEHLHSLACYSDPKADVETPLDWQELFGDYPYTGNLRKDLVGVAGTQVGYTESTLNFQADDEETRHGYTRYGAWYGAPYNEWSAMFVSFCLHYAGADLSEYPISSGADTMAGLWNQQGRYAPAGQYVPVSGDLVFFEDNTVGIVAEVQTATMYVISGDTEDAVSGTLLSLYDGSIMGWGITEDPSSANQLACDEPMEDDFVDETFADPLFDTSDGPSVFISEGNYTLSPTPQTKSYSLKNARTITNLIAYLNANGGVCFFTLLDSDGNPLPKDENNNYNVQTDTEYKLNFTIDSPSGFLPGTYEYRLPDGIILEGGEGSFVLTDGTNVGSWVISDDGLITLIFNENINNRTDITVTASLKIQFAETEQPIEFDEKTIVTVRKPEENEKPTKLNKWGSQGKGEEQDPNKIYWTLEITGQKDSQIPGSILTDQLLDGEHRYTESDIAGGLHIGVGKYDQYGNQEAWHVWDVAPDDPNLTWTETGWTYQMPESVMCIWCPEGPVTLGNEGWIYYVEYTSTPDPQSTAGTYYYTNSVTVDGQQQTGWGEFVQGEIETNVVKTGVFHGDADGGKFLWEFQVTIPGRKEGEIAAYYTQIMDHLRVKDSQNGTIAYITNDADKAVVTAELNGQTIPVPHVTNATTEDLFAWVVGWSGESGGINYTRALLPLCRCNCTAESCHYWNEDGQRCDAYHYIKADWGAYPSGFCYCWTQEQDVTFTFSYETDDPAVIEAYGGQGFSLQNEIFLQQTVTEDKVITLGDARANVPIPGVFKKELTKRFDGYTAHYQITINEAKLALTDGSPLSIHDVMTETLAYISGSLVITAEDADGNRTILHQGDHYTVTYDGSGNETDLEGNKVHVLDIVISNPQPVTYILDYDTTLIIPDHLTEAINYSNYASISLWGKTISSDRVEMTHSDFNIAAGIYSVELYKTDAQTNQPLANTVFGLYNAQDGLIASDTTDDDGCIFFVTNITEGIILREHELYYLQEIQPPPSYQLDDTKHWFTFCNNTNDACETCRELLEENNGIRIPLDQIGVVHATNHLISYELPSTGGTGATYYILCGLILTSAPLVYELSLRRKRERRLRE